MGLLSNSAMDINKATEEFGQLLAPGEKIMNAFSFMRDSILFTNGRLIFVDVQGVMGKQTVYTSFPYRSIVKFEVDSAGAFDLNATLRIWVSGSDKPMEEKFDSNANVYDIQKLIAQNVLASR